MSTIGMSASQSNAALAAEQARFNEKRWVWVPDLQEGYLKGWVFAEDAEHLQAEVIMDATAERRWITFDQLSNMNPPKFDRAEDNADLTFLNEASIVHNLRLRYGSDAIYTYSGLFLIAINPYRPLPLYSDPIIQQYRGKRRAENPPHIFAVAERAWVNMGAERENQSILITGESGAGKTESTKKVIQYLAAIATDVHLPSGPPSAPRTNTLQKKSSFRKGHGSSLSGNASAFTAKGRLGLLERQILQCNPILEAFGNAQTQRNNNSSRFGKFVRIMFSPDGSIAGANIDWYLLEKSRVVYRNVAERSFHVFYQMMYGADDDLRERLLIDGEVEDYEYLNKSRREVDGIDDREEWRNLLNALEVVGFDAREQLDLFRVIAAILHIGNIAITASRGDDAMMADTSQAERVCHLLGVPIAEFTRAVLRPQTLAGREWVTQARTRQQAMDELSALCKTLYEKSFGSLVERVNKALDRPSSKATFIGVLDIAGFEIFEVNGYEQLLINYTNEKLQQFFNHHMFVLEQEEYAREGIQWEHVNFGLNLQPTIDLIESSGAVIGILSTLDEECIMPKATDLTFTHKLNEMWSLKAGEEDYHLGKTKYEPSRFEQGFVIKHYADLVEYRTEGWLDKNKDPLNDNLTRVLANSSEPYISSLFAEYLDSPVTHTAFGASKKRGGKKGAFRTVAQRHKEQLSSLMGQLRATQPHFVRCIVPNTLKKPGFMDVPLVLDQLRCNGVLEGIRVARMGYPNRLPFVEFRQRYEILTPGILPRGYMDGREACRRMVHALELDDEVCKLGTSKIFFKAGFLAELEEKRDAVLYDIFSRLQATARMWTTRRQMRKILNRAAAVRTIQRNARVYGDLRDWPWWQLYTKVRPLLAATRNDEELRQKEMELALVRERAERDQLERQTLEKLKMALEAEKRKVEDALEAERALGIDKDDMLNRSKQNEARLEDEIASLNADIQTLENQLSQALKLHKESEDKCIQLRTFLEEASVGFQNLERKQDEWAEREAALTQDLSKSQEEVQALMSTREGLQAASEELNTLARQREEDLARMKERMELSIRELTGKLEVEVRNGEIIRDKADTLEAEARQAKEQLAELSRTTNDYSQMIQTKEVQIDDLEKQLEILVKDRQLATTEISALRADIDIVDAHLTAEREEHQADVVAKNKLLQERDELRDLLATKASEETRRQQVEQSKEKELTELREQVAKLHDEAAELRRTIDTLSRKNADLEQISRDHTSLQQTYHSLLDRERAANNQLTSQKTQVSEAQKANRIMESELLSLKSRHHDVQGQLTEVSRNKENLEKQLTVAQEKYRSFEDEIINFEREKESRVREIDSLKMQLETETAKRTQFEKSSVTHKAEVARLKEANTDLEKKLKVALDDLKKTQHEADTLKSKQNKTTVEHVYVLQEAKAFTDKQLQSAKEELQQKDYMIRLLQSAKSTMNNEFDDLLRKNKAELRSKEQELRSHTTKLTAAVAKAEQERKSREEAELMTTRLQRELQQIKQQSDEFAEQLQAARHAKDKLESELDKLVDETDTSGDSMAQLTRHYETQIAQMQRDLEEARSQKNPAAEVQKQVQRHHAEMRRVILDSKPTDPDFHSRLVREFEAAELALQKDLSGLRVPRKSDTGLSSVHSSPRRSLGTRRSRSDMHSAAKNSASDKQVEALKQQVHLLEVQMVASDRVRRHLEISVKELTAELEASDGSKQALQQYKAKLVRENAKLADLLKEEAQARRTAEAAQADGVQAMWSKFQKAITEERDNYARLEESKKALIIQQRATNDELEQLRGQLNEFAEAKKHLQQSLNELDAQNDLLKSEIAGVKRQLDLRLKQDEVAAKASTATEELRVAFDALQANERVLQKRYEETEMERAKAVGAEHHARRMLEEAEKKLAKSGKDQSESLKSAQRRIKELDTQLEKTSRDAADLKERHSRLSAQIEEERQLHAREMADRDATIEQMRKKYNDLGEDLKAHREDLSRAKEENRKHRSEMGTMQVRFNEEVSKSGGWRKEKERLETKISDLERVYEASTGAQSEQQSQIIALHSQVRELRSVLDDAENDRSMLQKARRALQAELDDIKLDSASDSSKSSSDRDYQRLQLRKQDLERSLEEQEDRVNHAVDRMRKAEAFAADCQIQLGKIRVENSELDKLNVVLEKQIKELNVRIVDMETKALQAAPPPPRPSSTVPGRSRIDNITQQLQEKTRERRESGRHAGSSSHTRRSPDKPSGSSRQRSGDHERRKRSDPFVDPEGKSKSRQ